MRLFAYPCKPGASFCIFREKKIMMDHEELKKRIDTAAKPYAEAIGQLIMSWNTMQDSFCTLFCILMESNKLGKALAIWHAIKNDRSQRELVKAIAPHCSVLQKDKKAIELISWAVKCADATGSHRDDAAHSPYAIQIAEPVELTTNFALGHPKAINLKDIDLLDEFKRIRHNAGQITCFVYHLTQYVSNLKSGEKPWPLPQKPSLQTTRPQKKQAVPAPRKAQNK